MKNFSIIALAAGMLFAGCGKGGASKDALPGTGEMKVINVAEAASPERGSILNNGDFDTWFAGAPLPEGVQGPDVKQSNITRSYQAIKVLKTHFQVNQIWKEDDAGATPDKLFGVFSDSAQANTKYTLHVVVSGIDGMTARLSVYEYADGKPALLAKDVITTKADRGAEYKGTFTTKKGGRLLIVSNAGPIAKKPARVVWHLWSVTPA